jgi:hypothetical protein
MLTPHAESSLPTRVIRQWHPAAQRPDQVYEGDNLHEAFTMRSKAPSAAKADDGPSYGPFQTHSGLCFAELVFKLGLSSSKVDLLLNFLNNELDLVEWKRDEQLKSSSDFFERVEEMHDDSSVRFSPPEAAFRC